MWIIYGLVGVSFMMALCFLAAFFWAQQDGQWLDTYTPSVRLLFEDQTPEPETSVENSTANNSTISND